MTLSEHLRELRSRLVKSSLSILLATALVWNQYETIFAWIRRPYDDLKVNHGILAVTGITSGFSLQMRVTVLAAIVLSSPIWIYQLWKFVAPGLHRREKKWAYIFTACAVPLFAAGVFLAYRIMPNMLETLFAFTPANVSNVTSVDSYLSFFVHIVLFFGLGFLLPLILLFLNIAGILSAQRIVASWRYLILGSFVFGAVATPNGDPLGMTLVAIPMLALSAIVIVLAMLNDKRRASRAKNSGTDRWSDDQASPLDAP